MANWHETRRNQIRERSGIADTLKGAGSEGDIKACEDPQPVPITEPGKVHDWGPSNQLQPGERGSQREVGVEKPKPPTGTPRPGVSFS